MQDICSVLALLFSGAMALRGNSFSSVSRPLEVGEVGERYSISRKMIPFRVGGQL
jgi:hypothetical protein